MIGLIGSVLGVVNRRYRHKWTTISQYAEMDGDITLYEADWLSKVHKQIEEVGK